MTGWLPQEIQPVVGDVVVMEVPVPGASSPLPLTLVVDAETGHEVESFGRFARDCATDTTAGASMVVCVVPAPEGGNRLASFRVEDRQAAVSSATGGDVGIDGLWQGGVLVTGYEAVADVGTSSAARPRRLVDLSGEALVEDLRGVLLASSDRYAVVACDGGLGPCVDDPTAQGTEHEHYAVYDLAAG
jgi:hypothetical protein